jgi:hypothetical protein
MRKAISSSTILVVKRWLKYLMNSYRDNYYWRDSKSHWRYNLFIADTCGGDGYPLSLDGRGLGRGCLKTKVFFCAVT